jgi:protein involved in polysaccharide export with SLBB domain
MAKSRAGLLLILVGAALCCVCGCAGTGGDTLVEVSDLEQPAAVAVSDGEQPAVVPAAYRLHQGDELTIMFPADRTLDYTAPVSPAGTVAVPSGGEVIAAGRTIEEVQAEIEVKMAELLLDPRASIVLSSVAEQPVYVLGEVKDPGAVMSTGTFRLSMAVAQAGGILSSGQPSSVMIIRTTGVEEATAIKVDLGQVLSGGDLSQDLVLEPYDVVFVPQSIIGKVNEFVDLFFNQIAPAQLFYLRGYDILNKEPLRYYQ